MLIRKLLTAISLSLALVSTAQDHGIPVFSNSRNQLEFPWAGGMNTCQFGKIDLDLDGIKDLVVFDRTGDRIMPFRGVVSGDSFDYHYAPEFASNFPELAHWVIFADYNLDGKEDIFTYSPGYAGLKVYRNSSSSELEFRLEIYPYLTSFQGGGYVNILVTYADFPAITDLDGDGDLDILTFWGLGSFVEKHRNLSMEKYGHADSLDFEKTEYCWGRFAESEETNLVTLDTCLRCSGETGRLGGGEIGNSEPPTADRRPLTADRHTGSTFCILDLNGDNLPDLLLGDVDYPNLIALYNGGSTDTALMTSYVWQYPPGGNTTGLFSMPAAFYNDFDFDGKKDLLVSPFDPNPVLPENFRSNWLYHNSGSDNQPQFSLTNRAFLQDKMLDFGAGAYPVFFDVENDGLLDLIAGNFGYYDTSYYDGSFILHTIHTGKLAFLKNSGTTTQPGFNFTENDFAGISALNLQGIFPAFADLDGDSDADMLLGCEDGQLRFFENTASPGETADFTFRQGNYQGIDVGSFSTPRLFDLDHDNLKDLVIGEKGGNLNFYRNSGTQQNPVFTFVTDSLGKINVTDHNVSLDGYSVPDLYRDAADQTYLLVGSEQGKIFFYAGVDDFSVTDAFPASDTLAGLMGLEAIKDDFGYRSSPGLADLDQDGIPELFAGNFSGGIEYFGIHQAAPVSDVNEEVLIIDQVIKIYPNPASDLINIVIQENLNFKISDISLNNSTGQEVFNFSGNTGNAFFINTGSLPSGIYFLRIILKNKKNSCIIHNRKIIVLK
jgi:hypothetical protein